jgi:hypothetical protein
MGGDLMDIFDIAIARKLGGGGGSTGGGGDSQLDALIDRSISGSIYSNVDKVGDYAFGGCNEITEVKLPYAKSIGKNAFSYCKKLKRVDLPSVETIGASAFMFDSGYSVLSEINAPLLKQIANMTFGNFAAQSVDFPSLEKVPKNGFYNCNSLTVANLPSITEIGSSGFTSCRRLNTLVLGNETVCTLSNVNAFSNTPFASDGTGGEAYVPQSLIEEYKIATNWSTLYEAGTVTFVAKEGSIYE